MSKMLLLSCCAPCACAVIDQAAKQHKDVTVLFYNPNIQPIAEYEKRREEQKEFCTKSGIGFIELDYDPENWLSATKGLEKEPERGARCSICFLMRLRKTAEFAKQNGFDVFSSVLGVSRYKDMDQVNRAAQIAATEFDIPYDATNWRKGGLEQQRQRLVKETHMYAQDYCGCPFSKR